MPSRVSEVTPLTMFPCLDLMVSYANLKMRTELKVSKALVHLPSEPKCSIELMMSAGEGSLGGDGGVGSLGLSLRTFSAPCFRSFRSVSDSIGTDLTCFPKPSNCKIESVR